MLVLTRKVGETIVIDGNIRVTLMAAQGGKIRVGIKAPASVSVDREEIHERRVQAGFAEWGDMEKLPLPAGKPVMLCSLIRS